MRKKAHCGGSFTYIFDIRLFQLSALLLNRGIEPFVEVTVDGFEGGDGGVAEDLQHFLCLL